MLKCALQCVESSELRERREEVEEISGLLVGLSAVEAGETSVPDSFNSE